MAARERFLDLMDRLERQFAPQVTDLLEKDMLALTDAFRLTRLSAAGLPDAPRELSSILRSLWASSITEASSAFIDEYREGFPSSTKAADIPGLIESYIQNLRPQVASQILETSRTQVRDLMTGGLASGESADAVYRTLLEKIPSLSETRGILISRTEIHAATQFAAWQLARRSSIPLVKVWSSVSDERTRDFGELGKISAFNHRTMDGVRADLNDVFLVPRIIGGYEALMFPGDPRGSASNIINCRCIQLYERA